MNPQLNNEAEINNLIKSIEYRTMMIRRIKNFTTITIRKKISNAVIIGKMNCVYDSYLHKSNWDTTTKVACSNDDR